MYTHSHSHWIGRERKPWTGFSVHDCMWKWTKKWANVRSMQQHQYNASSSTSTSSSSNSSMLNLRCIEAKRSSKTASTLKTADQIYALNILYNINAFSFSIPINGPMLTYTSFTRSKRSKNALSLLIGIWLTEVVVSPVRCCCCRFVFRFLSVYWRKKKLIRNFHPSHINQISHCYCV